MIWIHCILDHKSDRSTITRFGTASEEYAIFMSHSYPLTQTRVRVLLWWVSYPCIAIDTPNTMIRLPVSIWSRHEDNIICCFRPKSGDRRSVRVSLKDSTTWYQTVIYSVGDAGKSKEHYTRLLATFVHFHLVTQHRPTFGLIKPKKRDRMFTFDWRYHIIRCFFLFHNDLKVPLRKYLVSTSAGVDSVGIKDLEAENLVLALRPIISPTAADGLKLSAVMMGKWLHHRAWRSQPAYSWIPDMKSKTAREAYSQ